MVFLPPAPSRSWTDSLEPLEREKKRGLLGRDVSVGSCSIDHLPGKLKPRRRDKSTHQPTPNGPNRAAMAEILAEILEPVPIGNQGSLGLDNHQILGPTQWGDLENQTIPDRR